MRKNRARFQVAQLSKGAPRFAQQPALLIPDLSFDRR